MEERQKGEDSIKDEKRRTLLKGAIGLGVAASLSPLALHLTAEKAEADNVMTLPSKWDETIDVVVIG